jgi:hypothetical protein
MDKYRSAACERSHSSVYMCITGVELQISIRYDTNMPAIPDTKRELVRSLYFEKKLSAKKIGTELGVSTDAVYYFMRRHGLKRRSCSMNSFLFFENKPLSYKIKEDLSETERELKTLGVALYWCEGYKTAKSKGVDLANSDPAMVLIFTRFLREVCGVDPRRLRVLLYCYSDQDPRALVRFWSSLVSIPAEQFSKPYVRRDHNPDKAGKMPYGLVHIRYMDKKLLRQMLSWIEEYKQACAGGRAVNYTGL